MSASVLVVPLRQDEESGVVGCHGLLAHGP